MSEENKQETPKTLLETIEYFEKELEKSEAYWKSKNKPFVEIDAYVIKKMLSEIKGKACAEIEQLKNLSDWLNGEIEGADSPADLSHDFVKRLRERLGEKE